MKSGLNAAINGVTCIGRFVLDEPSQDNAVACSDSGGAEVLSDSNKDWRAVIIAYGHTPPVLPNDLLTFSGVDSDGEGWQSAANGSIARSAQIFCRSQVSDQFFYQLLIEGNGALTRGTYSVPATTVPSPSSSITCGITVGSTALPGIGDWDLLLEAALAEPVWPADSGGWAKRSPGNLRATLTFDQFPDAVTDTPALQADAAYKAYVTPTTFWELQWMRVLNRSTKVVVRNERNEPETIVARSVARWNSAVGGVQGHIKKPSTATYWP